MAHTPGPWRLHDMERATVVAGNPGGEVANCLNGFGDQDANTHLIIAAPEMADEIERLRSLLKETMQWINNWDAPFLDDEEWPETQAKIDEALKDI